MCIGARSGSNPGPLGSEPSALTNCAGCPLASIVYRGLKRDVTSCTMYLPVHVMYTSIYKIISCMQCTDYLYTELLLCRHAYTLHIHDHAYVFLYIHVHTLYIYVCIMFIHGIYRSKQCHTWYLQLKTRMSSFSRNQKNCIFTKFEPMALCILASCRNHYATSVLAMPGGVIVYVYFYLDAGVTRLALDLQRPPALP